MSFQRYFGALTLVTVVGLAGLDGCVANDRSLTINDFLVPMVSGTSCTATGGGAAALSGRWDVLLASRFQLGYDAFPEVQNNVALSANADIDTASFYLTGFDVQLEPIGAALDAAVPAAQREFNAPTATVRLAPGTIAGDAVEVIPAALATPLAAVSANPIGTLVVHVRPVATRAEEEVVGAYAEFPIDICNGCLTNALNGTFPSCNALAASAESIVQGNACNISADAPVTCCVEAGQLLCGPDASAAVTAINTTMMTP